MTLTYKTKNGRTVSVTENQIKKHQSQMTADELLYLARILFEICPNIYKGKNWHLNNRIDTGSIPTERYKNIIKEGKLPLKIVEYNETLKFYGVDRRVVVRSEKAEYVTYHPGKTEEVTGYANLCFVVSLNTGEIITAYYNGVNDNHTSLDTRRYDENLQIIKEEETIAC
jgi:hypothetical protein